MSAPGIFPILVITAYLHKNTELLVNQLAAYLLCFPFKLPPSPDPPLTVCVISQKLRIKLVAKSVPQGLKSNYLTGFLINRYSELIFLLFKETAFL